MQPSSRSWRDRPATPASARRRPRTTWGSWVPATKTWRPSRTTRHSRNTSHCFDVTEQLARRCKALLGLASEQTFQQRLIALQVSFYPRSRCVRMPVDDRHGRRAKEGLLASQHLVKDHAETVQITALVELPPV